MTQRLRGIHNFNEMSHKFHKKQFLQSPNQVDQLVNNNNNKMAQPDFEMAICGCCSKPCICIYDVCCPCLTIMEGAGNIDDDCPIAYCLATCLGLGCCALSILGKNVAESRGIEMDMGTSCCCACFNPCTCYSCRILNESRLYKVKPITRGEQSVAKKATVTTSAPKAQNMEDRA